MVCIGDQQKGPSTHEGINLPYEEVPSKYKEKKPWSAFQHGNVCKNERKNLKFLAMRV
jgi:hypothetical protein